MDGIAAGIGMLQVQPNGGGVHYAGPVAETSSPSFLAQRGDVLYAADEGNGAVNAFRVAGDTLIPLGGQPTSGAHPCHLTVTDEWIFASNYGSGSVDVFGVAPTGALLPVSHTFQGSGSGPRDEQEGPHAHSTLAVGKTIFSTDLGADRVHLHSFRDGEFQATGSIAFPPGTGPRDLTMVGHRVLVLGEFSQSIFDITDGTAGESFPVVRRSAHGDQSAALVADVRNRFLYTALRGSNRIAVLDAATLEPIFDLACGGDWPRHLAFGSHLLYSANQRSNDVASFTVDALTGILAPVGAPEPVPTPTCLLAAR
jgi:6-phosphogluconolactonase